MKYFSDIFTSRSSNDALHLLNQDYFDLEKKVFYGSPSYDVFQYLIDNYIRTNKLEAYSGDLFWDAQKLYELVEDGGFPNSHHNSDVEHVRPFCLLIRKHGTNHFDGVDQLLYFCKSEKVNKNSWVDAVVFQPQWVHFDIEDSDNPRWELCIFKLNFDRL